MHSMYTKQLLLPLAPSLHTVKYPLCNTAHATMRNSVSDTCRLCFTCEGIKQILGALLCAEVVHHERSHSGGCCPEEGEVGEGGSDCTVAEPGGGVITSQKAWHAALHQCSCRPYADILIIQRWEAYSNVGRGDSVCNHFHHLRKGWCETPGL